MLLTTACPLAYPEVSLKDPNELYGVVCNTSATVAKPDNAICSLDMIVTGLAVSISVCFNREPVTSIVPSSAASSSSSCDHAGTANKAAATPQTIKVLKAFPNSFIFIITLSPDFQSY